MSDKDSSEEEPGDLDKILYKRADNAVKGITHRRPMAGHPRRSGLTPVPVDSNRQPLVSHEDEEKSSCPERCIGNICWPCRVFTGALGLGGKKTKRRRKKTKKRRKKTKRKHKSHRKSKTHRKSKKYRSRTKHGGASLEEIPLDGDRQSANLIVHMLTNLEGMNRQSAIREVVNAYKNRERTVTWGNYLGNMTRIYGLAEKSDEEKEVAEQQEINRRERIADRTRIPLAATKEQEDEPVLAAQKSEEQEENNN